MKAILLRRPGGPEALEYAEVPTPVPGEGKVLVKADTIGVSMPEVLVRRGTYAWIANSAFARDPGSLRELGAAVRLGAHGGQHEETHHSSIWRSPSHRNRISEPGSEH